MQRPSQSSTHNYPLNCLPMACTLNRSLLPITTSTISKGYCTFSGSDVDGFRVRAQGWTRWMKPKRTIAKLNCNGTLIFLNNTHTQRKILWLSGSFYELIWFMQRANMQRYTAIRYVIRYISYVYTCVVCVSFQFSSWEINYVYHINYIYIHICINTNWAILYRHEPTRLCRSVHVCAHVITRHLSKRFYWIKYFLLPPLRPFEGNSIIQ